MVAIMAFAKIHFDLHTPLIICENLIYATPILTICFAVFSSFRSRKEWRSLVESNRISPIHGVLRSSGASMITIYQGSSKPSLYAAPMYVCCQFVLIVDSGATEIPTLLEYPLSSFRIVWKDFVASLFMSSTWYIPVMQFRFFSSYLG